MTASVPDETMRSFSIDGISARTSSASSVSRAVGAPKVRPCLQASRTAATTAGWAWPRIAGPQEPTKSTYSTPSASTIRLPFAAVTKRGATPVRRHARTGELTPPGISLLAAAYSSSLVMPQASAPRPAHGKK